MLSANNLQAQGALSSVTSLQQVLTSIQDVFPLGQNSATTSTTASTNSSLSGQLSNFWSAWDSVASNPAGAAERTQIVDMAQGLTTTLSEASTQLQSLAQNSTSQLQTDVTQANTLLNQAASLNSAVAAAANSSGGNNQLVDQLNSVVSQLASLAGVNVSTQQNGTVQLSMGGITVLQGSQASTLSTTVPHGVTPNGTEVYAYPATVSGTSVGSASGVYAPINSGTIGGLLNGINNAIPTYETQLNNVATSLATTVNTQLAQGYTASGASGSTEPLFTSSGTMSAASITVNSAIVADPSLIAAAGANSTNTGPIGVNDGSNAQAMAELGTISTGPDDTYQNLVEGIGSDTQNANSQLTSQTAVATQAQQALQSVSGVDTDQQLTALMQFQDAYQASAQVVNIVNSTIQSLMAAI
jgi:flagellar hook-associated protein 1 FlgK